MADVNSVGALNSLASGTKGLAWVGQCNGVDAAFISAVEPYIGNSKLFGFYLMDDPDPRPNLMSGTASPPCTAENLKAESDWLHAHAPGTKTFVALMNMSSSKTPSFQHSYNPANSHVDLFGIAPYPCRTELNGCDFDMINRFVHAAEAYGIARSRIVPIYQAFAGGNWVDDGGGQYAMPTVRQEQQILARWGTLVAKPVFDFAYSFGSQHDDVSIKGAPGLQTVLAAHNKAPMPGPRSRAKKQKSS